MVKAAFAVFSACFLVSSSACAGEGPIGRLFEGRSSVKVCIDEAVNRSGHEMISIERFKKNLAEEFSKRKSIKFEVVSDPSQSDVRISSVIKKYDYMERGPLKPVPGMTPATLLDAAATASHNYTEMDVEYTVTDSRTGSVLWKDDLEFHIKKNMTPEESVEAISDRSANMFIWKCFGDRDGTEIMKASR